MSSLVGLEISKISWKIHKFKGQCHEIFCFWFISWISFSQALIKQSGLFRIFSKIRGDIRSSICRRYRWYRWEFATGVVDTGGIFSAGIVDAGGKFATGTNNANETGGQICRRCRWYRWKICHRYQRAPWIANISANFRKKFEMVLMDYSGAGGNSVARSCQSFPASPAKKFGQFLKKYGPFSGLF